MDANGTRFHLLLTEGDWSRRHPPRAEAPAGRGAGPVASVRWAEPQGGFTLEPQAIDLAAPAAGAPRTPEQRRGAGCDRYGNWYWIDESGGTIRAWYAGAPQGATRAEAEVYWPVPRGAAEVAGDGAFAAAQPPQDPGAPALTGLAVTAHHFLVTFALEPARLLIFDLHGAGPPLVLPWPEASSPFDVAPVPEPLRQRAAVPADGGALVLDRERRVVWVLDRRLAIRGPAAPPASRHAEPFGPAPVPGQVVPEEAAPLPIALSSGGELLDPVAVEALDGELFLVLDRAGARVLLHRGAERVDARPLAGGYVPHDLAAVPDANQGDGADWRGTLHVASAEGNQSWAYRLVVRGRALELTPLPDHYPMRSFGGKALSGGPKGPAYDVPGAMVPLVRQPRPRFAREGALLTGVLEGDAPGCVWHRLLLDASVPPGCSLSVESRASDDEAALAADLTTVPFQLEPAPRQRPSGPEGPWSEPLAGATGTWELLFQAAKGRFLQLRVTLRGPGTASPRIAALRVWYPRFSWLRAYLPAVWRADPESAQFVDRFLANPEGTHTALEDRIASAQILFHPDATPPEALEWLASWVALALDPRWEERRKRLLLRHALDFYRWRGTARGIVMALRVALDPAPGERIFTEADPLRWPIRIVERFRTAQIPAAALGDPSELALARGGSWTPALGVGRLVDAYREALADLALTPLPDRFPAAAPAHPQRAQAWREVAGGAFGFLPTSGPAATRAWREFLGRRYATLADLRAAHGTGAATLADLELPEELPERAPVLRDWWDFQAIAERARLRAHQFTVVLPVALGDDVEDRRTAMEAARRLVELEKPAHTTFDVKLYWVAFRVGEARAGIDTVVGLGGRSPELMRPLVLGRGHVAESYLAHGPPQDATDRLILGRERLRQPKESP